nr:hypothetical protein [Acetobacter persici]
MLGRVETAGNSATGTVDMQDDGFDTFILYGEIERGADIVIKGCAAPPPAKAITATWEQDATDLDDCNVINRVVICRTMNCSRSLGGPNSMTSSPPLRSMLLRMSAWWDDSARGRLSSCRVSAMLRGVMTYPDFWGPARAAGSRPNPG